MKPGLHAAALLLLMWMHTANATITQLPGLVREPVRLDVTLPDGTHAELEALLTRPDKPGRFPVAIINHGVARDIRMIAAQAPESYSGPAIVFAQHGYAAIVVNRRGFGLSSELLHNPVGPCSDRDYVRIGRDWAVDVLAAAARVRHEPWADPERILLVGHSAGGFAALAGATNAPPGVVGIIAFSGAFGSPLEDFVCQPERLIEAMHAFGENVHIPSLWIYAQNDHFFGPVLARQMFDAYTASGAPAEFDAAAPFGRDGHLLMFAATPAPWWPRVASFLAQQHLPTSLAVELPPPMALPDPSGLDERGREDFAAYLASRSYEKAFATDGKGHYDRAFGQRSQEDAEAAVLGHCKDRSWPVRFMRWAIISLRLDLPHKPGLLRRCGQQERKIRAG